MINKLVIAEKPQLAVVISQALGVVEKKDGYTICNDGYVVTFAVGHILRNMHPHEILAEYKQWKFEDLPLKVRPIPLIPIESTKKQFLIVKELLEQSEIVINAGDPDAEGQLLIDEIINYCNFKGKQQRVLINDLDKNEAKKAFNHLKDNSEFKGMSKAALARSHADYIVGMNLTRAYTLQASKNGVNDIYSIGRVQTPTLGMIVRRYLENKDHKANYYFDITAIINHHSSKDAVVTVRSNIIMNDFVNHVDKKILDENIANEIKSNCLNKKVTFVKTKETIKKSAPLPFSLLDLQVVMNDKYNYTSDETLKITQDLREKHKAITYNRSDCRYLNEEQFLKSPAIIKSISALFETPSNIDETIKSRAFDDAKTTAHTAIIPTIANFKLSDLSSKEKNVYLEIANRFLNQFQPDKEQEKITVIYKFENGIEFKTSATKTIISGWDIEKDNDLTIYETLNELFETEESICNDILITKEKTKPKPIYTESTLLKDLQSVAKYITDPKIKELLIAKDSDTQGENGGIGTPATRSAIIKNLFEKGFFEYKGKKIIPTAKGIEFINALPDKLTKPDITALWFEQQRLIEKGELSIESFLDDVESFVTECIAQVDNLKVEIKGEKCNKCNDGVLVKKINKEGGTYYMCTNPDCRTYKASINNNLIACPCCKQLNLNNNSKAVSCSCGFILWKTFFSKSLTEKQIETILNKGKSPLLSGLKSKAGKEFEAYAKLDLDNKKIILEFGDKKTKKK